MRNFQIKSTWKTIHISYFRWIHTTLITIHIVHKTFPSLAQPPTSHILNHLLHSLSNFHQLRSSGAEPVLVLKIENTYYPHCVYTQGQNSVFQTPVIKFKSVRVPTSSPTVFWKRKRVKKNWVKNRKWFRNQFNFSN